MKFISFEKRTAYLVAGTLGILVAAAYLALTSKLPFGTLERPGAAVFPVFVSVTLVLGSLATLWEGWHMDHDPQVHLPMGEGLHRVLALVGLLVAYVLALSWLGQLITGAIFSALLMRVLSRLGWIHIIIYSLVLSAAIDLVFVRVLAVPLPKGLVGL